MISSEMIQSDVRLALEEDLGSGDISAALVDKHTYLKTRLVVREEAVICGQAWFNEVFRQCDESIAIHWNINEGDSVNTDTIICHVDGPASALLSGERTAMNFLQTLSGTATTTKHYADLIKHTQCKILDTRKTIPKLRLAQKYAVKRGGGLNHRIGLFDAFLIKENHLAAAGGIATAVERARKLDSSKLLEVEVETIDELKQSIKSGADRVLLDNFSLPMLYDAVSLAQGKIELEASGNITDESLVEIAEAGVDFISIGALTKHLRAVDFSLRFVD